MSPEGMQMHETIIQEKEWSRGVVEAAMGGAETILFVEDEAFVRNVTDEILRTAGYSVLTTSSAAEALTVFGKQLGEVDLLLTDVILPGESGRALAKKLRRQNPLLLVVFVTGYAEQMEVTETEQAEFLAKPFSTEILLRTIRDLLDRRHNRRREPDRLKPASGSA
jgi:two-component system, cell cycle sensor histidine kinase and response regulator CckA